VSSALPQLLDRVRTHRPDADLAVVERAFERLGSDEAHAAGRASALHCAGQVADLRIDVNALAACLLSNGAPQLDAETITDEFGEDVGRLVESVRRLEKIRWSELARESGENLRRMFMAMAADARVVVLVLAARVESMRALRDEPDGEQRRRVAQETLDVFAPLANRLGIAQLKWELEDLSLRELDPEVYAELKQSLAETRRSRDSYVEEIMGILRDLLEKNGIRGEVTGRPKHIYSIYSKMRRKGVSFDQIYDVTAVRVLVGEVKDCYAMLGLVHGLWVPIAGEFDDYIARPKENFYQSLHTAVTGPDGKSVEIQIRTREMHEFAEHGVAAHWAYKEGSLRRGEAQLNLLRQLMNWQDALTEADKAKLEQHVFKDRIYVLTPGGDVVDLPSGATPLDFAYRVHTMVGHRCRGAKVNGSIVTLDHELDTGDRVEILTKKHPEPSRDWLNAQSGCLNTAGARQKVRQWFRQKGKDESIVAGRSVLERELGRLSIESIDTDVLDELASYFNQETGEDLLAAIGFGDIGGSTVATRLQRRIEPEKVTVPEPPPEPEPRKRRRTAAGVSVDGIAGVMSQPARCCKPVPGDPVLGYVTRGRGIMIHHRECPNVRNSREPERFIEIDWGGGGQQRGYPVTFRVQVVDRPGTFRDVAEVVSGLGINIAASQTHSRPRDDTADITLTLEIERTDQISKVLERLERLAVVLSARRV
jgi:GTP pyrophosphokinase